MANTLEIIIRAVDKASKPIASITKSTEGLEKGLGTTRKASQLAGSALSAIVGTATLAGFAALTGKVISQAAELAKLGREVERVGDAYGKLWGGEAVEGLNRLREASNGTVADLDLMLATNKAKLLGVGSGIEDLAKLMQVAQERGRAMGLSTTQAFSDIVTGIGRVSPMILDNLGIVVDADNTYAAYAKTIGKAASELTDTEKKQALVNRVIGEANDIAMDSTDNWAALEAAQKNVRAEIGRVIDAFIEETGAVEKLTAGLNGLRTALEMERTATASAAQMGAQFTATLERSITAAGMNEQLYQRMEIGQRNLESAFRDGRITAEQYQDGINKLEDELRAATGQMSLADIAAADLQESLVRNMAAGFQAARGFDAAGSAAARMALQIAAAAKVQYSPYGYQIYGSAQGSYEAVQSRVEYLQIENERRILERQMEGGRQEQLDLQAKAATKSVDIAQKQFDAIRGIVESALSPTQVTAADLAATAAGTYIDKWDEAVRRYRMVEKGHDAAQIAEFERLFYSGQMLDQVNWDAVVSNVRRALEEEAGREALLQEAMRQVQMAGITASEAQLAAAMGMTDYQALGEEQGQMLAAGISAAGLSESFTNEFEAEWATQQDRWVTMGKMSVEWFANGIEIGSTPDVTHRLINVLVPRLAEALGSVAGPGSSVIPGLSSGGYASGITMVGERGPELVSLPRGSYVHDNRESERMIGGTTVTFSQGSIVVNNPRDARDVEIGVLRGLRAAGVAI